jgi:hypothetical protein
MHSNARRYIASASSYCPCLVSTKPRLLTLMSVEGCSRPSTLKAREKVLGREHPDTLTSVNNLGDVLSKQGKYEALSQGY